MKNSLINFFLFCFVSLTSFGYSEAIHYVEDNEAYNEEGIEYSVNPDDLALISGKLFLNSSRGLMPLTNLRYEGKVAFATPKAYVYMCPNCNQWAFIGHKCPKH